MLISMTELTKEVAGQVRAMLAKHKSKISEVSEATGIPLSTLNRRLSGNKPFNTEEIVAIADFLQIPPSSLLNVPAADAKAVAR